jgi:exosome complex exonuclease DIS3/RRP44
LSDDIGNLQKAKTEGLKAFSVRQYVQGMSHPQLLDMVAAKETDALEETGKRIVFPDHFTPLQINAGVKDSRVFQGTLQVSLHNYLEAIIFTTLKQGEQEQVFIRGKLHLNRAMPGDLVAVELLPRNQWRPTKISASEAVLEEEDEDQVVQDDVLSEVMDVDGIDLQPTGKVVGIVKRNWRHYAGSIDPATINQSLGPTMQQSVLFLPMDRRVPKIRLRTRQAQTLMGKRIVVAPDVWNKDSYFPAGHYVKTLGDIGDRMTETEVLLLENDVNHQPFSKDILKCLPAAGEEYYPTPEELVGRTDYRSLNVCSIDPPGCTDIDDALHCNVLPNGNLQVGVHIADVTHFVRMSTPMDEEASKRGTTVYLVDKRIDMLPSLLGTNLCSLRSNVDRLAFSVIWEITPLGEIVHQRAEKSIISSKASLTYEEAQNRIDDEKQQDEITSSIRRLNDLAKKLRGQRIERGALTLASPEVRFELENDSQNPIDVELKELKETNALVEEFMLLANITVARLIYERFPDSSLLRRHPSPNQSSFDALIRATTDMGITIDPSSSKTLAASLDKAEVSSDAYFNKLLRIMTTRCMMQAQYFCSGTLPYSDFWHYGLATDIYTHFTSPIRRYADIIVHRLLSDVIRFEDVGVLTVQGASGLSNSSKLTDKTAVTSLCENLNLRHRMAQQASRSSVELYTNLFFKGKTVDEDGYVIRVLKNGFVALIPKYGIESVVYVVGEGDEVLYDAEANTLTSRNGKAKIGLFDKCKVSISIEQKSEVRSRLLMKLLEPDFDSAVHDKDALETEVRGVKRSRSPA